MCTTTISPAAAAAASASASPSAPDIASEGGIAPPAAAGKNSLPNLHVSAHPVLSHKLSILRSSSTQPSEFRRVLREITFLLGYEATAGLATRPAALSVPLGPDHIDASGLQVADRISLIPVLRSGLGMVDSLLELMPSAAVHHVGMYRGQGQLPVQYYNRLPKRCDCSVAFVLDPVVGTGGTVASIVKILKRWGAPKIHVVGVVGAREGVDRLAEAHPDVSFTVGHVDECLTADGCPLPGLGDAGDRLFGTDTFYDEEALVHHSKRRKCSIDE